MSVSKNGAILEDEYYKGLVIMPERNTFGIDASEILEAVDHNRVEDANYYLEREEDLEGQLAVIHDYFNQWITDGMGWKEGGKLTDEQAAQLLQFVIDYDPDMSESEIAVNVLDIVTGESWNDTSIRGSSQSQYATVLYPTTGAVAYSADDINTLGYLYFNEGTEWHITEFWSDGTEEGPYSVYIPGYGEAEDVLPDYLQSSIPDGVQLEIIEFTGNYNDYDDYEEEDYYEEEYV
jgi:hypothetical protein